MIRKVVLAVFCLSVASCIQYAEPQSFLLPNGFTGAFVIVFNQKDGTPREYQNGRRIYRIPQNGVLFTQFDVDYKVFTPESSKTYYIDSLGRKVDSLKLLVKSSDEKTKYVLDSYSGGFGVLPREGITDGSSEDYPKITFTKRTVGIISMRDSLRGVARKKIDQLRDCFSLVGQEAVLRLENCSIGKEITNQN